MYEILFDIFIIDDFLVYNGLNMHIRAITIVFNLLISCFESQSYFLTCNEQMTLNDNGPGENEIKKVFIIYISF